MPTPARSLSDRLIAPLRRLAARDLTQTDAQLLTSFVRHRDPAAFEAIVRRHGPMVLGVCRRVVGHAADADDAFQAVFVVLARRAAAVRPRERVADFLFGVAYRTALKARATLARRRTREKQVDAMPEVAAAPPPVWADVQPVIDQELAALPDKLRLPVLLCDLQGRTQREAAKHLKLPPATLATRLASARRKLAERLSARGVTLAGGALAAVLTANAAKAVPSSLANSASGSALAAVGLGSGVVPANVLELSEGVMKMLATSKLKLVVGVLAAVGLLAGGGISFVKAADPVAATPRLGPTLNDKQFLTKTCEALRGSPPTPTEMGYFVADTDVTKRKKVVTWLTEEPAAKDAGVLLYTTVIDEKLNVNDIPYDLTARLSQVVPAKTAEGTVWLSRVKPTKAAEVLILADDLTVEPQKVQGRLITDTVTTTATVYAPADTDEAFLNRVVESARGGKPTRLEREYFLADKDAKKREKLLDSFLADAATAKKVGPEWKKNMLTPPTYTLMMTVDAGTPWADKLIDDLLAAKKSDDQILEALTLAATGRLPTGTEKKLVAAAVAKQKDKKAAWREVAGTLAGTDESKTHADRLKPQANVLKLRGELGEAPTQLTWEVKPDKPKAVEPKK